MIFILIEIAAGIFAFLGYSLGIGLDKFPELFWWRIAAYIAAGVVAVMGVIHLISSLVRRVRRVRRARKKAEKFMQVIHFQNKKPAARPKR